MASYDVVEFESTTVGWRASIIVGRASDPDAIAGVIIDDDFGTQPIYGQDFLAILFRRNLNRLHQERCTTLALRGVSPMRAVLTAAVWPGPDGGWTVLLRQDRYNERLWLQGEDAAAFRAAGDWLAARVAHFVRVYCV